MTSANSVAFSFTLSATDLSGNSGIARTTTADFEFGICLSSTTNSLSVISVLKLVGPVGYDVVECEVSKTCMLTLTGYFIGQSEVVVIAFSDALNVNPCHAITSTVFGPAMSDDSGTFNLGRINVASNTDKFTICWKHKDAAVYVPGGTLKLTGPVLSGPTSCSPDSDCVVTVDLVGLVSPITTAMAFLASGDCSFGVSADVHGQVTSPAVPVTSTTTEMTFNFGKLASTNLDSISVCFTSNSSEFVSKATPFPVLVGSIILGRVRCPRDFIFPPPDFASNVLSGILDPNCDVVLTTSSGNVLMPAIQFAVKYRSTLPHDYLQTILSSLKNTLSISEVGVDGKSVISVSIEEELGLAEILNIVTKLSSRYIPTAAEVDLAILKSRDDVMTKVMIPRMTFGQLPLVLVKGVQAGLVASVDMILSRGVDPKLSPAVFHEAVIAENVGIFKSLLLLCCPAETCLDVEVNGVTVWDRSIGDEFMTAIADAIKSSKGCVRRSVPG